MEMDLKRQRLIAIAACVVVTILGIFGMARAQVLTPPPEQLRFQALLTEPIATPDRRSVVAGTNAMVVKDLATGQCYVTVTLGSGMAMSPAPCVEEPERR